MAFNPFDVFRRNQRILFAFLTVLVMFMFVLSFGQGDFFSLVPKWLASRQRGGEVLAVVNGGKVYSSEIGDIESQRLLSNEYMYQAGGRTIENLRKSVIEGQTRVTAQNRTVIEQALAAQQNGFVTEEFSRQMQFAQMGFGPMPSMEDYANVRERTLAMTQVRLNDILTSKTPQEQDQTVARSMMYLIDLEQRLLAGQGNQKNAHYFTNQPNDTRNARDAMDFLLWLKKADQLGIRYTEEDLTELVNTEFFRKMTNDDWRAVEDSMRGKRGFTPQFIRAALADEFRVRAAQTAVLGQSFLQTNSREFDSPAEFYKFYREQCVPGHYGLIAVPTENFLDKVTGKPDETAAREFFNKGKNEDPNPGLSRFGLREPRKLKLEWLEMKGDEPYFKAAATEAVQKLDLMTTRGGFLFAPVGGVTLSTLLTAFAPAYTPNLQMSQLYKDYVEQHRSTLKQSWYTIFPSSVVPDTSLIRTPNIAAVTALLGGNLATGGSPLAAPLLLTGAANLADRKARYDTMPLTLMAPVLPGASTLAQTIAMVAPQAVVAEPLPLKSVQSYLTEQLRTKMTKDIAFGDVVKLEKDLTELKPKADSPEAKKMIDDFITLRGLKRGASKEFRDIYSLLNDEGLQPMKDKKDDSNPLNPNPTVTPLQFGQRFFFDVDRQARRAVPSVGFYKLQPYPAFNMPMFMAWRVAEQAPEALRDINLPESRAKIEAAWRRKQARELAKKAAEGLAAKCANLGNSVVEIEPKLKQLQKEFAAQFPTDAAKEKVKYFTIDDVAPIVSRNVPGSAQPQVGGFGLAPSDNLQYPTQKMAEDLLKNKDKPFSTNVVLTDNPEDTYYVAVLMHRTEKDARDFETLVYGPQAVMSVFGPIVKRQHQFELRKKTRESAMALLKAEFGYDKESDGVNKKVTDSE